MNLDKFMVFSKGRRKEFIFEIFKKIIRVLNFFSILFVENIGDKVFLLVLFFFIVVLMFNFGL